MADITTSTVDTSTSTANYPNSEQRVQAINNMYDANINAQKANLESAYQTNLANAQADKAKIADQYTGEKNNLAATYERQRRNNNLQASSNGLNTGAGSQMALAQQANYQSNMAQLGKAQAQAEADADRNISNLTLEYQSAVNSAVAQNDYQKAAALLDEYNNQMTEYYKQQDLALSQQQMGINQQNLDLSKAQFDYNKEYNQQQFDYTKDYNQQQFDYKKEQAANEVAKEQANALAQYGDFSGYATLYGQDVADNMAKVWALSNPQLAYTMGKITADDYYKLTGSYPAGYVAPSSGGGYSSYVAPTSTTPTLTSELNAISNDVGAYKETYGNDYVQQAATQDIINAYRNYAPSTASSVNTQVNNWGTGTLADYAYQIATGNKK